MGNRRLEDIIEQGYKCNVDYTGMDLIISKIITTLTLMPDIGFDYDFSLGDDLFTHLEVFSQTKNSKIDIAINGSPFSMIQAYGVARDIYNIMNQKELIEHVPNLDMDESMLYSAIVNLYNRLKNQNCDESEVINYVEEKALKMDTFRKIASGMQKGYGLITDRLIATSIASLNYYTDSDKYRLENLDLSNNDFGLQLYDIQSINRAINLNILKNKLITNDVCLRHGMFDKKSSYLAGFYSSRFKRQEIKTMNDIDTGKCFDMLDEFSAKL